MVLYYEKIQKDMTLNKCCYAIQGGSMSNPQLMGHMQSWIASNVGPQDCNLKKKIREVCCLYTLITLYILNAAQDNSSSLYAVQAKSKDFPCYIGTNWYYRRNSPAKLLNVKLGRTNLTRVGVS